MLYNPRLSYSMEISLSRDLISTTAFFRADDLTIPAAYNSKSIMSIVNTYDYAGTWQGTTNQGKLIQFVVDADNFAGELNYFLNLSSKISVEGAIADLRQRLTGNGSTL